MLGFVQGCTDCSKNESNIPGPCLSAYGDGYADGYLRLERARFDAKRYDCLEEVNAAAFSMWNITGRRPDLPSAPAGSGCMQHYCWMPVDTTNDNNRCKAHGGKDAPLPKAKK